MSSASTWYRVRNDGSMPWMPAGHDKASTAAHLSWCKHLLSLLTQYRVPVPSGTTQAHGN